jgi:hypothetical protein
VVLDPAGLSGVDGGVKAELAAEVLLTELTGVLESSVSRLLDGRTLVGGNENVLFGLMLV